MRAQTPDPFAVFDYPRQIMHVPITVGSTNQSTGVWQPPGIPTPAAITGDLQDIKLQDLQRLPEGIVTLGDRRIITTFALSEGDLLQVTESDSSVSVWIVNTVERASYVMPKFGFPQRTAYLLKRHV